MILGLLGGKQQLGIDIGQNAVKISQLVQMKKGEFALKKFAYSHLSESAIMEGELNEAAEIIQAISYVHKNSKFGTKDSCIGLSGSGCVVKTMQVPDGDLADVEDNAMWESEQYIPFGVDNAEVSLHISDSVINNAREVVMAAAKTSVINSYTEIINNAGLKVKTVDIQTLALINLFEYSYSDNLQEYQKGTLLIDLGAQTTKVVMYKAGLPLMVKSMMVGGVNATEEIQKEIGLDFNNAEELKKSNVDGRAYPDEVVIVVKRIVSDIVRRIYDSVTFYNTSSAKDRIYHCFVTGGNMRLPGIIEGLIDNLDLSVETLDPLRKIKLKGSFNEGLVEYITYSGAVSLGLSLRSFD